MSSPIVLEPDRRSAPAATPAPPTPRSLEVSPERAFVLPLLFTAGLLAVALYPPVRQTPRLLWSFLGTAAVLLAWNGVLYLQYVGRVSPFKTRPTSLRTHRVLTLEIVL